VTANKVIHQYMVALFIIGLLVLPVKAQITPSEPIQLALGYGKLTYPLPAVGSYQLPVLGIAADGNVLDDAGKPHSLSQLLKNNNKYTLLSFVYSNCSDVNGCPLVSGSITFSNLSQGMTLFISSRKRSRFVVIFLFS